MEPKFNPGDRVRAFQKLPGHWNNEGRMDHWLGKIMTISAFSGTHDHIPVYHMKEDVDERPPFGWSWREDCLEPENAKPPLKETDLLTILEAM